MEHRAPQRSLNDTECQQGVVKAVRLLKDGGVVAFPTDTLYGLGADVFSLPALRRVFAIKGRPEDLALPVLLGNWEQLEMVAQPLSDKALELARRFWPGNLTLVFPKAAGVPDLLTAGRPTVAVRMPGHRVARALAEGLEGPITGTSANASGGPDPLTLAEVEAQVGGLVDYLIRCGPVPQGTSSTIVDVTSGFPKLIRQGALPFEEVLGSRS